MMSLVVVAFVVIGATLSDGALTNHTVAYCEKTMNSTCQRHIVITRSFVAMTARSIIAYVSIYLPFVSTTSTWWATVRTAPRERTQLRLHRPILSLVFFGAITNGIDDRLRAVKAKNISVADAKKVYTVQDHANKVYVRNPDCWAYDLDLTSISPWNSNLANRKAGTLVSPRHALWARHYSIKLNSTIRFVDQNNNVVDRRVVKTQTVSGPSHSSFYGQDIVVGELDIDVPNTISFAKVMPRNLTSFRVPYSTHIPAVSTDQEEKALVDDFYYYSSTNAGLHVPLTTSIRHDYYESKISGDSGNPTFFVIDDQLALLFVFTTGGAGGGTSINHYFDNINEIMAKEGGGYQLTEINLSKYLAKGESLPGIIGK
ncbi:uncharacterized protein LOC124259968 [Haliotis rubra]|uniref:uncharacterized protein LOC124259968 n=1 Tax=Haliotis rubra TaxID=36100 RepID=UPI001EE53AA6|nr:uncharacterized protein LOC124259968 [Haliotis rubra]